MSGYYEDPNADWNAQFEQDPAAAAYELAQTAIAQNEYENARAHDEQRVAVNAAAMLAQAHAQQAEAERANALAQQVNDSMTAEYGNQYVALKSKIIPKVLQNEAFGKAADAFDANTTLQIVDRAYQEVVKENDPATAEWAKIKAANGTPYWESNVINDALGRS